MNRKQSLQHRAALAVRDVRLLDIKSAPGRVHFDITGQATVTLKQTSKHSYSVQYGQQLKSGMTYGSAAAELGACLMHALCCAGELDKGSDDFVDPGVTPLPIYAGHRVRHLRTNHIGIVMMELGDGKLLVNFIGKATPFERVTATELTREV